MNINRADWWTRKSDGGFVLPDAPPREMDDLSPFDQLAGSGMAHYLVVHLGKRETTTFGGNAYVVPEPKWPTEGQRIPDLMVAFDTNPDLYKETNGYVISEQGKPPDFIMEAGTRTIGHMDVESKRMDYASMGIREYWRFDETGGKHLGAPLAGDRLVGGKYEPIPITTFKGDIHQGYSAVLGLDIRWTLGKWSKGWLSWYYPMSAKPIPSFDSERKGRLAAEARARQLEAIAERALAEAKSAWNRIRELEEELRRTRQQD